MNGKVIKVIGLLASVDGVAASVVTEWVGEKKMNQKIEEKVIEEIAKRVTKSE